MTLSPRHRTPRGRSRSRAAPRHLARDAKELRRLGSVPAGGLERRLDVLDLALARDLPGRRTSLDLRRQRIPVWGSRSSAPSRSPLARVARWTAFSSSRTLPGQAALEHIQLERVTS